MHRATTRSVEEEFVSGDFTAPGSFTPVPPGAAGGLPEHATRIVESGMSACFTCGNLGCANAVVARAAPIGPTGWLGCRP